MPKRHILSAGLVSMTERGQTKAGLKEVGKVEATYCSGDEPIVSRDGEIGLIDEVVMRAQRDSQVTYIKNAQFYSQGACVSLEGTGLRDELALKKDSIRK